MQYVVMYFVFGISLGIVKFCIRPNGHPRAEDCGWDGVGGVVMIMDAMIIRTPVTLS